MEEIKLNPTQSWSATLFFLDSIWEKCKDKFSDGGDELGNYLGSLTTDPASRDDWKETYEIVFGKILSGNDLLTPEQVFTLMIELTCMFLYKFEYQLNEIVIFLYSIRFKGDDYNDERILWDQTIKKVIAGQIWEKMMF